MLNNECFSDCIFGFGDITGGGSLAARVAMKTGKNEPPINLPTHHRHQHLAC